MTAMRASIMGARHPHALSHAAWSRCEAKHPSNTSSSMVWLGHSSQAKQGARRRTLLTQASSFHLMTFLAVCCFLPCRFHLFWGRIILKLLDSWIYRHRLSE